MAPKQKHHSANQKGKATQRGDSNPFVIARRQKVAQLYSFHHLSAADIYRLFKTDPKLRPYWTQDEEGNPLRPPSKSTIEADVRKLKEKFREERLETYTYLTNLTQFRLERLFARAVEKEDFGLAVKILGKQADLLGLGSKRHLEYANKHIEKSFNEIGQRLQDYYKDDPEHLNEILNVILGNKVRSND